MKEYFLIGKIVRPHGVKGVVRAETYTSNPKRFKVLKELSVDGQVYEAESIAIDSDGYMLIKLKGINTMDDAEKLRGKNVVVKRTQLPKLPNGNYYIDDLIGCDVLVDGDKLGTLSKIDQFGSADVYEVTTSKGNLNFPALKEVFRSIDVEKGIINLNGMILSRISVYN